MKLDNEIDRNVSTAKKKKGKKTYNNENSLVVTHPTTNSSI